MIRKHIYLTEEQVTYLENSVLPLAEHIRRALDLYISTLKKDKASTSPSTLKGAYNGR